MFGHSRPHFYHKRLTLNSTIKIRFRLISTLVREVEVTLRNYPQQKSWKHLSELLTNAKESDRIVKYV